MNFLLQEKRRGKSKYLDGVLIVLAVLVLIEFIVLCLYEPIKSNDFSIVQCKKMENTFEVSWGSQKMETAVSCMIDNPDMDTIYIKTVLHKSELGGGDGILFRSRQSGAKVYLDEELVYDSGDAYNYPFLLGYGSFWRSLKIGDDYDGKTLTIELKPLYALQAVSGYIPDIYFGTQASFMIKLFRDGFWYLVLTVFLVLLGIALLAYGIRSIWKKRAYQTFFLGLFSVDTGLWMLMETHVLEIFLNNNAILICLTLSTYGMMPVLLVRFLLSYDEFQDKIYLRVLYLLGSVLNIGQILLAMTGIRSQFETQGLNRIYLGLTVVGLLMALKSAHAAEKGKRQLYSGLVVLAVSTVLELVNFLLIDKKSSGRILILGICLFIVKSGIDLIRNVRATQKTDMEQALLLRMAYTDGMTHLGNRYAYDEEKDRLEEKENTRITILIADMNGLKRANDRHGHSYGDQIICRTADMIAASFEKVGKCFRIGGDEFCVLAENAEPSSFESCIRTMEEKTVALQKEISGYGIAYGVAEGTSKEMEDIFHLADNRMYSRKKEMREGR